MLIHPSAVISPEARIAPDVRIGPHAVIEGAVEIGARTVIGPNAVITGRVRIGARNTLGPGVIIGTPPQDLGFDPATDSGVWIGEDNTLREYVTIHRATVAGKDTTVGHRNFLMVGAHLAHDVRIGSDNVIANNALVAGHTVFGDRIVVGGGSVFHQGIRVGDGAMTQGISGFGMDVPPFTVGARVNLVVGLNVIGLRRAGRSSAERLELKRAFHLLYREGLNTSQALEKSRETEWTGPARIFWDFVASAGKRGICGFGGDESGE